MTKKSAKKQASKKAANPPAPASRLAMEQTMRNITRLLHDKKFADIEEMNAFLATLTGADLRTLPGAAAPLSPREEAQELADQAMDARTEAQARKLIKRALAKDPDCVDALVALTAMESTSPKQAVLGLQKAVEAGERSLGAEFFKDNKGHFWGLVETRPYMRARQQLAEMFIEAGLVQDAISQYQAMLHLNPNDNQGVREPLLGLYLQTGDSAAARKLLTRYKGDASATFAWGRVLERFLAGDLVAADASLKAARKANPYMELYMSGKLPFPKEMPDSYAMGSPEEAVLSLESVAGAWIAHPEAMFWLLTLLLDGQPANRPMQPSKRKGKDLIQ